MLRLFRLSRVGHQLQSHTPAARKQRVLHTLRNKNVNVHYTLSYIYWNLEPLASTVTAVYVAAGAVYSIDSQVTSNGNARFTDNTASASGGEHTHLAVEVMVVLL